MFKRMQRFRILKIFKKLKTKLFGNLKKRIQFKTGPRDIKFSNVIL